MKYLIISLIGLMVAAITKRQDFELITPDHPCISYEGRIDSTNKKRIAFMYSGVSIKTSFRGRAVSLLMVNDSAVNYYNVIIDGKISLLKVTNHDSLYTLASGLENKLHSLVIFRRTEWHAGNSYFLGLRVSSGSHLYKPQKPIKQIEFIGNSLTCGYGIEGKSNQEHFKYETENSYLTYAALTARALNEGYTSICRSGIGIYSGRGDTSFSMSKLFGQVCHGCKINGENSGYQPDKIIIELGINDFAATLDSQKFVNAYVKFIKMLKTIHPTSKIICLAGPYPGGDNNNWHQLQSCIKQVVLQSEKEHNVYLLNMGLIHPNGSDWHPSAEQHELLAQKLIAFIKTEKI